MTNTPNTDLLLAGIIGAARGLRGEVSVEVRTDRAERVFQDGATVHTSSSANPELVVARAREHGGRLFVQFEDVTTREAAEALRGVELLVEAEPEDDAWYAADLEGLEVTDVDGKTLGVVTGLVPAPAHDLLIVRVGQTEVMVPFVEEIVPTVSVEDGRVVVDAPAGLFPDGDEEPSRD